MDDAIVWFDIPTLDFERAVTFYSEVLGTDIKVDEFQGQTLAFFPMKRETGIGGDIIPPDPGFVPGKQGTRIYLNCFGKIDEAIARVVPAGGKIVRDKFELPTVGFMAVIEDTEGNQVGLFSERNE